MSKSINSYMPKKEARTDSTSLVQAKIPTKLKKETRARLKARRWTWDDLIIAACKQLNEST